MFWYFFIKFDKFINSKIKKGETLNIFHVVVSLELGEQ